MVIPSLRYLEDGPRDGAFNMAGDQALLILCNENEIRPTLRLYGWSRPTVSVGYSGKEMDQIDLELCRKKALAIVKRPTGGGVLLHTSELTYSLIAPIGHPSFPKGLRKTYNFVSEVLLAILKRLGVNGNIQVVSTLGESSETNQIRSPACFGNKYRTEIMVNGKKIIGSAQRRLRRAFLQHGSLLIHFDPEKLNELFLFSDQKARKKHLLKIKNNSTSLAGEGAPILDCSLLKVIFLEMWVDILSIDLEQSSWTSKEMRLLKQIKKTIVL